MTPGKRKRSAREKSVESGEVQIRVSHFYTFFVGPLPRVRPRNGILALGGGEPLRSEFIGEL